MATPFVVKGFVFAPTGSKVVAALELPLTDAGVQLVAPSVNITGGTAPGVIGIGAGNTAFYLGLIETPGGSGAFEATGSIGGNNLLPDAEHNPYTIEARVVDPATNMASYAGMVAAFAASSTVVYPRNVPPTLYGGLLKDGQWQPAHYATVDDLREELGSANSQIHADLENEGRADDIDLMEDDALDAADVRIDLRLSGEAATLPLSATDETKFARTTKAINRAARKYAAGELLNKRWKQSGRARTAGETGPGDAKIAEGDEIMDRLVAAGLPGVEVAEDDTPEYGTIETGVIDRGVCNDDDFASE